MRIISQDGCWDINYNNHDLCCAPIYDNECHIKTLNTVDLGTYSSKEKALKVMERIRDAYHDYIYYKLKNQVRWHEYQQFESPYSYFHMPQDNEVKL